MRSVANSRDHGCSQPGHACAPSDAPLAVEHLTKRFGDRTAFVDVEAKRR